MADMEISFVPAASTVMESVIHINKKCNKLSNTPAIPETYNYDWQENICPLMTYLYTGMNIMGVTHNILLRFKSSSNSHIACPIDIRNCG